MSILFCTFALVKMFIFSIIIIFCMIYCLPILLIPRFHCRSNLLPVNLSLAFMCCCTYWMIFCISYDYFNLQLTLVKPCTFQIYIQTMCTCQLIFAFIAIPINQLLLIIYQTKFFFKTKNCLALGIIAQWIVDFIVSIPLALQENSDCIQWRWTSLYKVIMIVLVPSLIYFCMNIIIFIYIRSAFRIVPYRSPIFTFSVLLGGWYPIFILIAIDFGYTIHLVVYIILAEASLVFVIINLFRYNQKLRQYLKDKILRYALMWCISSVDE